MAQIKATGLHRLRNYIMQNHQFKMKVQWLKELQITAIAEQAQVITKKKGDLLMEAGTKIPDCLYVIKRGVCSVRNSLNQHMKYLKEGAIIGELDSIIENDFEEAQKGGEGAPEIEDTCSMTIKCFDGVVVWRLGYEIIQPFFRTVLTYTDKDLNTAFNKFDEDSSGGIDKDEFDNLCTLLNLNRDEKEGIQGWWEQNIVQPWKARHTTADMEQMYDDKRREFIESKQGKGLTDAQLDKALKEERLFVFQESDIIFMEAVMSIEMFKDFITNEKK